MSYCRWSCDNFKSDVYCYEHGDGTWTTHVAGYRRLGVEKVPPMPNPSDYPADNPSRWTVDYLAHHEALDKCELVPIGLPHDGKTYKDKSPKGMLDTLLYLREQGYHVPEHAIDALREEIADAGVD